MTYIEPLAQGSHPYNLLVQPYKEGWRNLTHCTRYRDPALHALAGILLLIPLINTLVFLVLRTLTGVPVMNDTARPLTERPPAGEFLPLNLDCPIIHKPSIRNHLEISGRNPQELQNLDGRIFYARHEIAAVQPTGLPEATFRQVGGVHQQSGGNHLCGYYALYYMYQAVSGNGQFTNRQTFHPFLDRWTTMIAERRATAWLRNNPTPVALEISVRGVDKSEIQYLIQNDPALAVLNQRNNCFLMEDEWAQEPATIVIDDVPQVVYLNPITPLGNETFVNQFPIYFILKVDSHYYFVWAETPWEFQVVHSMGYSIINPLFFKEETFYAIIESLQNHPLV